MDRSGLLAFAVPAGMISIALIMVVPGIDISTLVVSALLAGAVSARIFDKMRRKQDD